MVALATPDDVAAVLGRDLTFAEEDRLTPILLKASELFRRESGQHFTESSSRVRLKVDGCRVYLPQRPVVSITSVVDDDGDAVEYTQDGQWLTVDLTSDRFVFVDYEHGSDTVPDLVRLTIAEIGMKVLSIDSSAAQGVSQESETVGSQSISRTYAGWAIGATTSLSPEDKAIAKSYRFRPPRAHVMVP